MAYFFQVDVTDTVWSYRIEGALLVEQSGFRQIRLLAANHMSSWGWNYRVKWTGDTFVSVSSHPSTGLSAHQSDLPNRQFDPATRYSLSEVVWSAAENQREQTEELRSVQNVYPPSSVLYCAIAAVPKIQQIQM